MNKYVLKRLLPAVVVASALSAAIESPGCSVPVFRYALERWGCDEYRLVVAAKGELPPEQQKWAKELERQTYRGEGFCNLRVFTLDVTDEANKKLLETYPAVAQIDGPTAFLFYPSGSYLRAIILQEPFTEDTVKKLTSSPFVDEVAMDILKGESIVWVLVDSGNQAADDAAYATLSQTIAQLPEQIELPPGIIETSGNVTGVETQSEETVAAMAYYDPDNVLRYGIPLKIGFSVKRLAKSQAEPILREILMDCAEDLKDYQDQPLVFPVFGRGRFLPPLAGEGINADNIGMACMYICGSCSCQVKEGNPGVDLLNHVDWDSYLEGSKVVVDRELPPLTGTGDLVESNAAPEKSTAEPPTAPPHPSPLGRNLAIMIGAMVCIVGGATFAITKRKRG